MLKYVIDTLQAERSGDRIPEGVGGEISPTRPDQPWGPYSLLYDWYWVSFLGVKWPGYAIRRVQVNQDGLKLNGAHQLLSYADDVNILGGSIHTLKENAEA
jgi:hypothetical protein